MSNLLIEAAAEFLSRDTFNKGDHLEENRRGLALIQDPALAVRMADKKKALKALGIKKNPDQKMEDVKLTNTSINEGVEIKPSEFHAFRKGEKTIEQIASEKKKPVGVVRGELNLHADHWSKGENHYNKLFKVDRQTNEEVEELDEISKMAHAKYRSAARADIRTQAKMLDADGKASDRIQKRVAGLARSTGLERAKSMTKEEVESVSEGSGPLSSSDYMKGATRQDLAKGGSYQGKEIKSFHPNKEKEAREYAKKHGYVVKKKELPKGSGSAITHTWDIHKEGVELDEEKLSNWSFNDLHAHLKKNGWERDRNSKHIQYVHPVTKKTIAVPHKHGKTVAPGTVRNILQRMAEEHSDYGRALAKIRGRLREEMEELEELKKSTLKSYVSKAAFDAVKHGQDTMANVKDQDTTKKSVDKAMKRLSGIRAAVRKM